MKKIIFFVFIFISSLSYSQSPQGISYQSIAYDSDGILVTENNVRVKLSILDNNSTGPLIYSETHLKLTNSQGLYSLIIGQGVVGYGTFSTIKWGIGNKFLKVELDPIGGINYTATGTSQFVSVPYAFYSENANTSKTINTIANIAGLRLIIGNNAGDVSYVKDYENNNDGGGGNFIWRINGYTTLNDNGGTIIKPTITNPTNGRWIRNIEGTAINVKWFGILGLDVDYSPQLNALINTFNDGKGVKVVFPKGIYKLKNISVYSGFTFVGEQTGRNNWIANSPVMIKPATGATNVFNFLSNTQNASLENLNIDGDYQNITTLETAVLFSGKYNLLYNNNIVNCFKHAVYGDAGGSRIEKNNLHGLKGSALPYGTDASNNRGFLGTLHLNSFVDGYLIDNEIGSTSLYSTFKNSDRKSVALFANTLASSVINGNIIENGDRGAYIMNSGYNSFSGNRYEVNAGGGLEIYNIYQCVFYGERFQNNSLKGDGLFDDLVINENCSNSSFISPIFTKTYNPSLGSLNNNRSKYNITNYRSNGEWGNKFVTPYFNPLSFFNSSNSAINLIAITPYIIN